MEYGDEFQLVKISGIADVPQGSDRGKAVITITNPDSTQNSHRTISGSDGYFELTFPLYYHSQIGIYKVFATFDKHVLGEVFFTVERISITESGTNSNSSTEEEHVFEFRTSMFEVATDSLFYEKDEIIHIVGVVPTQPNLDLTLQIIDPMNNRILINQITPNSDGTFEDSINTNGPLWKFEGDYNVRIHHNEQDLYSTFSFSIPTNEVVVPNPIEPSIDTNPVPSSGIDLLPVVPPEPPVVTPPPIVQQESVQTEQVQEESDPTGGIVALVIIFLIILIIIKKKTGNKSKKIIERQEYVPKKPGNDITDEDKKEIKNELDELRVQLEKQKKSKTKPKKPKISQPIQKNSKEEIIKKLPKTTSPIAIFFELYPLVEAEKREEAKIVNDFYKGPGGGYYAPYIPYAYEGMDDDVIRWEVRHLMETRKFSDEILKPYSEIENNILELLANANSYFHLGQYKKSISHLDRVLQLDTKNIDAFNMKCDVYDKIKDYDSAYQNSLEILKIDPANKNADKKAKFFLWHLKDYKQTIEFIDKSKQPTSAHIVIDALKKSSNLDSTLQFCDKLIQSIEDEPESEIRKIDERLVDTSMIFIPDIIRKKIEILQLVNDHPKILIEYEKLMKLEPSRHRHYYLKCKAEVLIQIETQESCIEAIKCCDEALKLKSKPYTLETKRRAEALLKELSGKSSPKKPVNIKIESYKEQIKKFEPKNKTKTEDEREFDKLLQELDETKSKSSSGNDIIIIDKSLDEEIDDLKPKEIIQEKNESKETSEDSSIDKITADDLKKSLKKFIS